MLWFKKVMIRRLTNLPQAQQREVGPASEPTASDSTSKALSTSVKETQALKCVRQKKQMRTTQKVYKISLQHQASYNIPENP